MQDITQPLLLLVLSNRYHKRFGQIARANWNGQPQESDALIHHPLLWNNITYHILSYAENHETSRHEARSTRQIVKFRFWCRAGSSNRDAPTFSCASHRLGGAGRIYWSWNISSLQDIFLQGEYIEAGIYQAYRIYLCSENVLRLK